MKTYDITIERQGESWSVGIPELGAFLRVDSLEDAVRAAQEHISARLRAPVSSFIVTITRLVE